MFRKQRVRTELKKKGNHCISVKGAQCSFGEEVLMRKKICD